MVKILDFLGATEAENRFGIYGTDLNIMTICGCAVQSISNFYQKEYYES